MELLWHLLAIHGKKIPPPQNVVQTVN